MISAKAGPRLWAGFIAMSIGMFMAVLDIQIVASSLPEIQTAFAIPFDRLGWVQTAYLSSEVVAIPLTGWITRALSTQGALSPRYSALPSRVSPARRRPVSGG